MMETTAEEAIVDNNSSRIANFEQQYAIFDIRRIIMMDSDWRTLRGIIANDAEERSSALVKVKDAIIGSNRQKDALISNGLVPEILKIAAARDVNMVEDKINALIILGSLAKGNLKQVSALVHQYNVTSVLINEITHFTNNRKCMEICLSTLRSLYTYSTTKVDPFFMDGQSLSYFLGFASPESSVKMQICVTSILVSLCQTPEDQMRLLHAGTIHCLARMIFSDYEAIQVPALRCLSAMCYNNRAVTDNVCVTSHLGRSLPDILQQLMSRLYTPEIQLSAAKCLTYIYRSGTLLAIDHRIIHRTLPCLTRLCTDAYDDKIRAGASETLAYLIEIDSGLQRTAAISNHLLKSLAQQLACSVDGDADGGVFGDGAVTGCPNIKQASLKCFASLGANDENIRKRIIEAEGLIEAIVDGLSENNSEVKMASVRCLHSLSRSVQQLRTTFQDHQLWKPLFTMLTNQQSPPSLDLQISLTSTICNLLIEFSPSKEQLLSAGIIEHLCQYTEHQEPSLRLNSIWALMNMSYQAEARVKTDILTTLGPKRLLDLFYDSDTHIVMKALGLLRNLLSQPPHVDQVMSLHSEKVLESVNMLLESSDSNEIKEQALCVVANIAAAEAHNCEYIINDAKLMAYLAEYVFHTDQKLQAGALFTIKNIVQRKDALTEDKCARIADLAAIKNICEMNQRIVGSKVHCEDYISRTLIEIMAICKHFCPADVTKN